MSLARAILRFWLNGIGPEGWFKGGDQIDRACRPFAAANEAARRGAYRSWLDAPDTALAYLILTDQISRNLHRASPLSFAADGFALSAAFRALERGHDRRIPAPARLLFYMPFEHAEDPKAQNLSVRLFRERMPARRDLLLHARAHRATIARFGRFPGRNAALGRVSTEAERKFLEEEGGYGGLVRAERARMAYPPPQE
jgi:uncharacterized protein (DUF924 family)